MNKAKEKTFLRNLIVMGIWIIVYIYPMREFFLSMWKFDILTRLHWKYLAQLISAGWHVNTSHEYSFIMSLPGQRILFCCSSA